MHRLAQCALRNKVVVAIANKLARIAWAVLFRQRTIHFRQPSRKLRMVDIHPKQNAIYCGFGWWSVSNPHC